MFREHNFVASVVVKLASCQKHAAKTPKDEVKDIWIY